MGDPFSVAGTAVGITSLGIQTFQILYSYYSQYKGYHEDIDNVLRQVEGLQGILEALRDVKARFEIDNHGPSSQLLMALKTCEETLAKLKSMADQCNTVNKGDIQARLRNVRKRLMWPFKKETLADMQATLGRFQDNLSLALQCAGLDGLSRELDRISPKLNAIRESTTNIERDSIEHTQVLGLIHQGVADVSYTQHQHQVMLDRGFQEASRSQAVIISKMNLVLQNILNSRDPARIPPSLLADAMGTVKTFDSQMQTLLWDEGVPTLPTEMSKRYRKPLPRCGCRPKKKRSIQQRRWYSVLSEDAYEHDKNCPRFSGSDYMQSVAAQFSILNDARHTIKNMRRIGLSMSMSELTELFASTSAKLQISFNKDANPSYVDQDGDGILHYALRLLFYLVPALNEDDPLYMAIIQRSESEFSTLITFCDKDLCDKTKCSHHVRALASWPQGLQILCSSSQYAHVPELITRLWHAAVDMVAMASLVALIPFNPDVIYRDWNFVNFSHRLQISQPMETRIVFDFMAQRLRLRDDSSDDAAVLDGKHIVPHRSLYSSIHLCIEGAQSAWDAGYRDVNVLEPDLSDNEHPATPLWHIASGSYDIDAFEWLIQHGANPAWIHPIYLTTPVHAFIQNNLSWLTSAWGTRTYLDDWEALKDLEDLLLLDQRDCCLCHCSQGGCHVIGRALLKRIDWQYYKYRKAFHESIQPYCFKLVHQNSSKAWISSAVLRILTFAKLGLTHTCCYRVNDETWGRFHRPTPKERETIVQDEQADIRLLEKLVTEFEDKWATYTRPFVTFMNRVWRPRMRRAMQERVPDVEQYKEAIRGVGVILDEGHDMEEAQFDSDVDWPDDYESEGDGWYTTDEEDENGAVEELVSDEEEEQEEEANGEAASDGTLGAD
ncbi:hypothetical protein ACEQ8H_001979 [Pleosporales sp. CAS-2024a]